MQDILYDNNGDVVIGSDGQPKTMSALMDETNALIDEIKEDLEDYEELDIEAVQQLVKDQYIDPIEKNAQTAKESFIQRNNDEKEYIGQYNTAIGEFDPQINAQFVAENIAGMTENNMNQQTALAENNMAYAEYANRVFEAAMENVSALQESIAQTKESSDQAVADALREAKGIKEETSAWNQDVLASFSKKLPYTRLGSAEYTQAYQFIANPVNIEDRSEGNERTVGCRFAGSVCATERSGRGLPVGGRVYRSRSAHPYPARTAGVEQQQTERGAISCSTALHYKMFPGKDRAEKEERCMSIRMDTDEVVQRGYEISGHVEDVDALQQYLNDVVNNQLPELWQGSGYEGFASRVAEMAPSFQAMRELISDIGQGVVTNAEQYAEFDKAAGAANRG